MFQYKCKEQQFRILSRKPRRRSTIALPRIPKIAEDYNLMVRDIYNVPLYIKWQLLLRIPWTLKQKQIWGWYCQITVYKLSWLLK